MVVLPDGLYFVVPHIWGTKNGASEVAAWYSRDSIRIWSFRVSLKYLKVH